MTQAPATPPATDDQPPASPTAAAADATATPATPAGPAAPTAPVAPAAPAEKTFTQAEVDAIVAARLERAGKQAEKTLEERLADIESRAAASEKAAVNAIVAKAAAAAHNPAVVAQLVDLGQLTSADAAAIEAKVAEYLTANPYLIKTDPTTTPQTVTPTPGAGGAAAGDGGNSALMSDAEFDAVTPEELAADDALMQRYLATIAAKNG